MTDERIWELWREANNIHTVEVDMSFARLIEAEAIKLEREACASLYAPYDVAAPVGNSAWGEGRQDGWIEGTQAYRDAIRSRTANQKEST
jgi:hypothetical protein